MSDVRCLNKHGDIPPAQTAVNIGLLVVINKRPIIFNCKVLKYLLNDLAESSCVTMRPCDIIKHKSIKYRMKKKKPVRQFQHLHLLLVLLLSFCLLLNYNCFVFHIVFLARAVASWLVRSTPDRAVRVRDLPGDIVLCCVLGKTLNSHSASAPPTCINEYWRI